MASAFYPTGDGHVGNLGKKTLPELKDLLARQQKMVQKRNFLHSLPDGGTKILKFVEMLERTIKSREKSEQMFRKTEYSDIKTEVSGIRKDGHKGASKFKKEREKVKVIEEAENKTELEAVAVVKNERFPEQMTCIGDVLEHSFQSLTVEDESEKGTHDGSAGKSFHYYQLAEERAKQNATELKEPLKLNSYLKVSKVQELPPKFVPPQPVSLQHGIKMETESLSSRTQNPQVHVHRRVTEDTAATPPTYKFEKAKEIPLEESIMLQRSQLARQDELQAEIAAERLTERLHIKLEHYYPEGVDMSYRASKISGHAQMIDSDDDDDDNDGIIIQSDSDDS